MAVSSRRRTEKIHFREGAEQVSPNDHFGLVKGIVPGYQARREKFQLSSMDTQSNALANRLMAQYVLK